MTPSLKDLFTDSNKLKRVTSTKLDISSSPQDFINNFILDKIQGFDLENYYGNPQYDYSSSYSELDMTEMA